jgi:hypothetical protein
LKIALSFDFAHEIENISDLSIEFEERKEKLFEESFAPLILSKGCTNPI